MKHEPTRIEVILTRLAFLLYGRSVYKAFAERLSLKGNERALDFGCGMGTVAYYAAKKLPDGHLTCLDISERWLKLCRKTLRGCVNVSFQRWEAEGLPKEGFDLAYCHFVLHDIPDSDLERVIPVLAGYLKPGGVLAFREPLKETGKLNVIKHLLEQNSLFPKDSRITDIPMMGNALESIYIKE